MRKLTEEEMDVCHSVAMREWLASTAAKPNFADALADAVMDKMLECNQQDTIDAARLDYLESLATYKGRSFMGGTHHLEFTHDFDSPNANFRAAIDAAMKGETP